MKQGPNYLYISSYKERVDIRKTCLDYGFVLLFVLMIYRGEYLMTPALRSPLFFNRENPRLGRGDRLGENDLPIFVWRDDSSSAID